MNEYDKRFSKDRDIKRKGDRVRVVHRESKKEFEGIVIRDYFHLVAIHMIGRDEEGKGSFYAVDEFDIFVHPKDDD
jgi:hypothetical protein